MRDDAEVTSLSESIPRCDGLSWLLAPVSLQQWPLLGSPETGLKLTLTGSAGPVDLGRAGSHSVETAQNGEMKAR